MTVQSTTDNIQVDSVADNRVWIVRSFLWLWDAWRPAGGWSIFALSLLISTIPASALRASGWADLGRFQIVLDVAGPAAIVAIWLLRGWRTQRTRSYRISQRLMFFLVFSLLGFLFISQLLLGWIPGPAAFRIAYADSEWIGLLVGIVEIWTRLSARVMVWWNGVSSGGAAQDDLVFSFITGMIFWLNAGLLAWLVRARYSGLLAGAVTLWLTGTILIYSSASRSTFVGGLALVIILHLLLDHQYLQSRWEKLGIDFSAGVFLDRALAVAGVLGLVLAIAITIPNLFYRPIVIRYYEMIGPYNERVEELTERLFPDIRGTSRMRSGGLAGGLPNEFLLRAGPQLTQAEVFRFRTDEAAVILDYPFEEYVPPPGHYMRGGTLTVYDGRGWSNPPEVERTNIAASEQWYESGLRGRKSVIQSVNLIFNSQILYTAPEPVEVSADFRLDERAPGDIVALRGRERSYTVVSEVPAVNDAMLEASVGWGEDESIPPEIARHVELPDTITSRTRNLTDEVLGDAQSPFAKAYAIEQYLRTFEYDLSVAEPPRSVDDVADYFLFDLQRGYCDYYTTAFIVMARLAGLPARFATGFAIGRWDPVEAMWIVTESESHSWPEVYFREYGWIPFEPTAGRPELIRIGIPEFSGSTASTTTSALPVEAIEAESEWSWQTWLWAVPLLGLAWGAYVLWQRRRAAMEDPWQALLHWGRRAGRPIGAGETVLEYGNHLATYVIDRQAREPDTGRYVANEVRALSGIVNLAHYGPSGAHDLAVQQAVELWNRLRDYLPRLKMRKRN